MMKDRLCVRIMMACSNGRCLLYRFSYLESQKQNLVDASSLFMVKASGAGGM